MARLMCSFGLHEWKYTAAVYRSPECERIAVETTPASRVCLQCGVVQVEDRHCLGLNPPEYTSRWYKVSALTSDPKGSIMDTPNLPTDAECDMDLNKKIELIGDAVATTADHVAGAAGYAGAHDDGGASRMCEMFEYWADGIRFAQTGETKKYNDVLAAAAREKDPEYKKYLELRQKFGDIK